MSCLVVSYDVNHPQVEYKPLTPDYSVILPLSGHLMETATFVLLRH